MNTRPKSSGYKSLEEILAEEVVEVDEPTQAGEETKITQSSPLDDAFDAHTVIRPMTSYPPPPKPGPPPPPPVQTQKPQISKSEEKQDRPPPPPRSELAIPLDIPRPPQTAPASSNPIIAKIQVASPVPEKLELVQAKKEQPVFEPRKVSKSAGAEPSSVSESSESSFSGITDLSEVTSAQFENPWNRIPKRLIISAAGFVLALGFWITTRHSAKNTDANSATKLSSQEVASQSPSEAVPSGLGAARPTVTPPPAPQVPASDAVLSSFDRAFTKTQDQARYSTNRL